MTVLPFTESTNLPIRLNDLENAESRAQDQALFAMMLDEGLSPTAMVEVIRGLYEPGRAP